MEFMSYSIEVVNGCTKKIAFNFPDLDLGPQIEKSLKETQKKVSLKGFREGKAPLEMIKSLYSPQIESDALNNFIQDELFKALQKENLNPIGQPSFENIKFEKNKSISFDVVVELFPDFELKDYSKLSFKKEPVLVTDEELESARKSILEAKAEIVPVTDGSVKLSKGHHAIFNFEGVKASGERPENMKGKDFDLVIGSGRFIPGFEEAMVGMVSGEKKNLDLTFPADYQEPSLRGEKVTFEVELLEIKEKKYPELTPELLKDLGVESAEELNQKNKERILTQKEMGAFEKLKAEIMKTLTEENDFTVPKTLVQRQYEMLKKEVHDNLGKQGHNHDKVHELINSWEADLLKRAEDQVRGSLILDALAKKFAVEVTENDINSQVESIAMSYGMPVEEIKKFYNENEQAKRNLIFSLREEQTFKKLMSQLKIS
jgi:trigger factor